MKYFPTLLLLLFPFGFSQAQITITADDFNSPLGDTIVKVNTFFLTYQNAYFLPPQEGPDQSWDYRWLELTFPEADPELEGSDDAFPTANNIDNLPKVSAFNPTMPLTVQRFERYDDTGKTILGNQLANATTLPFVCSNCSNADSVRFEAVTNTFEQADQVLQLPLVYEGSWTTNHTQQINMQLFLPTFSLNDVSAQQTDSITIISEVTGWGTLILPNLTRSGFQNIEVLLIKKTRIKKTIFQVDGMNPPQALLDTIGVTQGQVETSLSYQFMTKGLDQPALSIDFAGPGIPPAIQVAGSLGDINPKEEGQFIPFSIQHDGNNRSYHLYIPPGYTGDEATPLVVGLHGYTSNATQFAWQSRMNEIADTAGFMVVYPQGMLVQNNTPPPGFPPQGPGWNVGLPLISETDDVGFIVSVVDDVIGQYNINEKKVYATGISNGGFMSSILACERPDRFAATASAAGPRICEPSGVVPKLFIHGTNDIVVPFNGIPEIGLTSVPESIGFYALANGCSAEPDSTNLPDIDTNDGTTVTKFEYSGCQVDGEIIFYRINGGGHVWEDGGPVPDLFKPVLGANVNRDFSASSTIWNFFNQYELPNAQILSKTIMVDTIEREYLLYVPAAYDDNKPWPLVFNLHGAGSNAQAQMTFSGMNAVADTAHFLIAYPTGISNRQGQPGWNEPKLSALQDDVQFVSDMIDQISSEYMVDPARVYATGMSNGGGMSFTLACSLSDRLAAIASVSAPGTLIEECQPGRSIPIMYIHGTADVIVPFQGGPSPVVPITFPPARDRVQFWLDNNGCTGEPVITEFEDINTADSSTVTLEKYSDCDNSTEVFFYVIDNGGHTWPGGPAAQIPPGFEPFFGNINQDINASVEIWNFFNRHTLITTSSKEVLQAEEINLQVFPNPFSDQMTFTFEIPETQRVQLNIFNALGQPIKTLIDQRLPAGPHRIEWTNQSRLLPSGMYYYRLQLGARWISRPIVIN